MIRFEDRYARNFIRGEEMDHLVPRVLAAHDQLHERTGPGSEFTGWLDLPAAYDRGEYARLKEAAARVRNESRILLVIGIGGSYLGARAAVEMLCRNSYNAMAAGRNLPEIHFAGHHLDADAMADLLELLGDKDITVNVISKSGATTEPAVAFRIVKAWMEKRYGVKGAAPRIIATTDRRRGHMRRMADEAGYETFVIPDDVGGRFSVLTPVGLLPMAACGIDTDAVLAGAAEAMALYGIRSAENPAGRYASCRNILYRKGYTTEIMANYTPALHYFTEWWKQLYGESEGKDGKGIFPAGVDLTTDLHSMGQYIQDGRRQLFETVLWAGTPARDFTIPGEILSGEAGATGDFLGGKLLSFVNRMAMEGTIEAHVAGGAPNLLVSVQSLTAPVFGALVYFFEMACALSGYLLGVNPFDQPGVEAYKKNMFRRLGKDPA